MSNNCFLTASSLNNAFKIKGVNFFATDFISQHYHDDLYQRLNVTLPQEIKGAVTKRKAEYLAGRYIATKAVNSLGINIANIPTGPHRSPVFPEGIVASISHTNTTAICVAALTDNIHYLGIDLEHILHSSTINEIESSIINASEKKSMASLSMPYEHSFSLVFSAKESLFKALYPSVKNYFDFSAAQLIDVNEKANRIKFELNETLSATQQKGKQFNGVFRFNETDILTCIYEEKVLK